ncbi:hypothetical protein NTJ56_24250 [Burkholderia contaminans]|uniref:hypothetical protein n=1 Tax=Burkholderia contaminans TaxID=488447 RepID=UPI001CF230CE|nr:hypothetical protein [Burkholderia contaminans]MCA7914375.1 hypothetical protein [Burkholderia contaminans]MCA8098070.1 hypothetical protein [Burkholderia contaminans]UUX41529.1 hypothetical protein NTJ56_24250 [Burkholderia contaminans]
MKGGANESEKMVRGVTGHDFSLVLIITPARQLSFLRSISALDRRVILSVFSRMNQIRCSHGGKRMSKTRRRLPGWVFGARCRANRFSFVMAREGVAHAVPRGLPAEMPAPPALRGGLVLKFETRVHQAARCGPAGRIHPSNPAIASRCSVIGAGVRLLLRYIPETKNVVPGAAGRRGGRLPPASCGGISRGTLLAVLDASAGG